MPRALAAAGLLVLAGCATAPLPSPDEPHAVIGAAAVEPHTPSDWRELRSEHFTLTTDFDEETGRRLIARLERLRHALLYDCWGVEKLEGDRTRAIIFASSSEFADASDENVVGFATHGPEDEIVSFGSKLDEQSIFAHELTHVFEARFLRTAPPWFNEGLAVFFATIDLDYGGDPNTVELGDIPVGVVRYLKQYGRMPVAKVLAVEPGQFDVDNSAFDAFEPTAWLLTYYLYNTHPDGFRKYQVALAHGTPSDEAWAASFPDVDVSKLDHALTLYLSYGRFTVFHPPLPPEPKHAVSVRELADAEVRALRAHLILNSPGERSRADRLARAKAELAPAIAAAPDDPHVVDVEFAWMKHVELRPMLRKVVAAHPSSALAWHDLGDALSDDDSAASERLAAYRRAVELDGGDSGNLNALAGELLEQGRPAEALKPALEAARANPSPEVLEMLARALAQNHRCAEAVPLERRAIQSVPAEARGRARGLVENLSRLEARCAAEPPAQGKSVSTFQPAPSRQ